MTTTRTLRLAREVLLTAGAVIGVLCIVVTAAGLLFGIKPLLFRSGSMAPTINTGDLSISRTVDASTLKPGDIVSVLTASGERVTHRLVSTAKQGELRRLRLKGDANKDVDAEVYTEAHAQRVLFTIPKLGYVIAAGSSPAGLFVGGLYVALLASLIFRRAPGRPAGRGDDDPPGPQRRAKVHPGTTSLRRRAAKVSLLSMGAAVVSLGVAAPTWASPWTNDTTITGTTFTAATVPSPGSLTCTGGLLSIKFSWPAVAGATSYTLYVDGTPSTETGTMTTISGLFGSGSAYIVANVKYGSTATWSSAPSPTRSYTIVVVGSCN